MNSRLVVRVYSVLPRWFTLQVIKLLVPPRLIGVVVVVFNQADEVLLLKHTYHRPPWRLPGGLMNRREQPADTAVREVMEEAQCRVRVTGVIDAVSTKHTFDVGVVAELEQELPFQPCAEVSDRRWVPVEELTFLREEQQWFVEEAWRRRRGVASQTDFPSEGGKEPS